jgi:hypothetical protein
MTIETIKIMLDVLENHTAIKHPQQVYYRESAIQAGKTAIAEAKKQKPVAWMFGCIGRGRMYAEELDDPSGWQPLYTHPQPKREPLTNEQIREFYNDNNNFELTGPYVIAFARAIEAAHGIKE